MAFRGHEDLDDDDNDVENRPNVKIHQQQRKELDNVARGGYTPISDELKVSPKLKELTEEDYNLFIAKISLGCSDYAAAAILGVTAITYKKWLAKGRNCSHGLYRRLYLDVCRAKSIARCSAEIQVKKEKPELWLTKFGGRSEPGVPGWTELDDNQKAIEQQLEYEAGNIDETPVNTDQSSNRLLPSAGTFQQALASLQELGLIQVTEHGKNVLNIHDALPSDVRTVDINISR